MGTLYTYTAFVGKFNVLQIDVVTGPSLIYIAYIIDRYFIYIYIHVGKFNVLQFDMVTGPILTHITYT